MVAIATLGALEPEHQRLVNLMQAVNYGRIQGVPIRSGRIVLDPPPRILRDFKPGGDNGRRPESRLGDFALKKEVAELLNFIAGLDNATIHNIEISEGLPRKWTVEEDVSWTRR